MIKTTSFYNSKQFYILLAVIVTLLTGLAFITPKTDSNAYWYSLVPPILAIVLASLSKRIIFSLFVGVLTGGLLAFIPNEGLSALLPAFIAGPSYIITSVIDFSNLRILFFISCVLMMIAMIMVSGGFQAVVLYLKRFAKDPYSTKLITALMGVVLCCVVCR